MQGTNQGLGFQVLVSEGVIPGYTISAPGTDKNVRGGNQTVAVTAGTAPMDGPIQQPGASAAGDLVNIPVPGQVAKVLCGASMNRGVFITAGTGGKAIAATTGDYYIGFLADVGVDGEISEYVHCPGFWK